VVETSRSLFSCILSALWYRFDIDFTGIEINNRKEENREKACHRNTDACCPG
jgi:hypothetical protein